MKILKLGDICEISTGSTDTKDASENGQYPLFDRSKKVKASDKYLFDCEALIMPGEGAEFLPRHYIGKFDLHQRAYAMYNFSELINPLYLYYYLISVKNYFADNAVGATVKSLRRRHFTDLEVPLPSLEKQSEIVKKLDSAFAEIELLDNNLDISEGKANELLKSILDYEYSSQDIEIEALENLVDILDNQRIPINATERLQRTGDVPYYGATGQVGTIDKSIFNETLLLLGEDGVPFFDSAKHKAYEISGPSWVNNHAHVLRAKPEVIVQRYLLHFLNIFNYTGFVNGATRLKLTQGDMKRIPVPVPDLDLQKKIVAKIDLVFEQIKDINFQISLKREFAKELRQSLLNSAFAQEEAVA